LHILTQDGVSHHPLLNEVDCCHGINFTTNQATCVTVLPGRSRRAAMPAVLATSVLAFSRGEVRAKRGPSETGLVGPWREGASRLENALVPLFEVGTYLAHNVGYCVVGFRYGVEIFATTEQAFPFVHLPIRKIMNCVGLLGSLRLVHLDVTSKTLA